MPGLTPFGIRVAAGQVPPLDPASQPNLEIYLADPAGIAPATGLPAPLTRWADQSGNGHDFSNIPAGVIPPTVFPSSGLAVPLEISYNGDDGGSTQMVINNALPGFTQARGSTQYALARVPEPQTGNAGARVWYWPNGGNSGPSLIFQAGAFSFFGGVPNSHTAMQIGAVGYDLGPQRTGTWNLYTIVSDTSNNHTVYRDGALLASFAALPYLLQAEMDIGGPSLPSPTLFEHIAGYLLYTAAHTPNQVRGVYAWYKANYGF